MRRSDREIKEAEEIIKVMEQCDVCRLALNDDGYPYIIPLNFGMERDQEQIILYFHGASEGRKLDLIARDSRASFEMDCSHRLVSDQDKGYCTMEYESVIGRGRIEMVPEQEKCHGLNVLVDHYHEEPFAFNPAAVPRTAVFRLLVEQMTGKRRIKKG